MYQVYTEGYEDDWFEEEPTMPVTPTDPEGVRLCATPYAALDAWDADPRCAILVNADATLYAVGHEQVVAYWYPRWHQTSPEALEDLINEERARLARR